MNQLLLRSIGFFIPDQLRDPNDYAAECLRPIHLRGRILYGFIGVTGILGQAFADHPLALYWQVTIGIALALAIFFPAFRLKRWMLILMPTATVILLALQHSGYKSFSLLGLEAFAIICASRTSMLFYNALPGGRSTTTDL